MPRRTARYMLAHYWDGKLPVDPVAIARAANVTVQHDPDLGEAFGRFEFVEGRPWIFVNPDEPEMRQRFVVAHELGHYALRHGRRFIDTRREFAPVQLETVERQANRFALELLVPGFVVNILIGKRNITDFIRLTESFAVSSLAMKSQLKKHGWL